MGRRGRPRKVQETDKVPTVEEIVQLIREVRDAYAKDMKTIRRELIASRASILNLQEELGQREY